MHAYDDCSHDATPEIRSVVEHQQAVAALFGNPRPVLRPLTDVHGAALAREIVAPISLPPFDNSAMDGFAVRSADLVDASPQHPVTFPVTDDIPAGRTDVPVLAAGTAHRIMTGAPVPSGADVVIPVEAAQSALGMSRPPAKSVESAVTISSALPAGRNIRRVGSDITAGAPVLAAGTVIGAAQIGILAALGFTEVPVYAQQRVAILSTGTELVRPGSPLLPGQIYESNGAMLTAACIEAGAQAQHMHFVPDDIGEFLRRLREISVDADLIITSGGVSAGAYEVVKEALTQVGGVEFVKVAMQPGKPQGCGRFRFADGQSIPIITVPGNPVSSMVSFEVFIREPLRAAMGLSIRRERLRARLDTAVTSPPGKRQFQRGVFVDRPDGPWITPIGPPASHHLSNLAHADVLVDIPADAVDLAAGDEIEVIRI
ncbi:UNVERIFIED_ORG: molybdopterin molybdotransferase [Gordonia westfalica J30]